MLVCIDVEENIHFHTLIPWNFTSAGGTSFCLESRIMSVGQRDSLAVPSSGFLKQGGGLGVRGPSCFELSGVWVPV